MGSNPAISSEGWAGSVFLEHLLSARYIWSFTDPKIGNTRRLYGWAPVPVGWPALIPYSAIPGLQFPFEDSRICCLNGTCDQGALTSGWTWDSEFSPGIFYLEMSDTRSKTDWVIILKHMTWRIPQEFLPPEPLELTQVWQGCLLALPSILGATWLFLIRLLRASFPCLQPKDPDQEIKSSTECVPKEWQVGGIVVEPRLATPIPDPFLTVVTVLTIEMVPWQGFLERLTDPS